VNPKLLGTTSRNDGKIQVTYNGWPLYSYVRDSEPGQTKGEAANLFGAHWYVLNTKGQEVKGCPPGFEMTSSGCLPQRY
jgi:hypothetical protein